MATAVDPPTLTLQIDDLVDWLELTALFDEFRISRVDALIGSLEQLEETQQMDIDERDRWREQLFESIENEVELRKKCGGAAYPFSLSDNGEELEIDEHWQDVGYAFYLICLITTHVTGSAILKTTPTGALLTRLRNRVFQIIATLGMAGLAAGPALSVGWPRRTGEPIVELLARAVAAGAGFTVRNPPGQYVSPDEKDGGVDVIAWTPEIVPPPTVFFFGQAASGRNWPGKPVVDHARVFSQAYMQDHMTGNRSCVTMIPHRILDDAFWNSQHQFHMSILDRLRLPPKALRGLEIYEGGSLVDEADQVGDLTDWLQDYINFALAA